MTSSLSTITKRRNIMTTKLKPIHPGEILREEFLLPLNLTANALARALSTDAPKINDIVNEKRRISSDTALRLARYFGMSAEFWLGLQMRYDLEVAADQKAAQIEREVRPRVIAHVA